jgi:hypothetical protein
MTTLIIVAVISAIVGGILGGWVMTVICLANNHDDVGPKPPWSRYPYEE